MGAYYSSELGALRPEEVTALSENVNFSPKEIQTLYVRFQKLDRSGTGVICRDSLLKIPELAMNPLVDRIVNIFETDEEGNITFTSFLSCLSCLSINSSLSEKLSAAFRVYDANNDGYVSADEVFEILSQMVGSNMSEDQIRRVSNDTVKAAASDGQRMSRDDFNQLFQDRGDEINSVFGVKIVTIE